MKTSIALLAVATLLTGCGGEAPKMQPAAPASSSPAAAKAPDENATLDALRKTNEAQATYFKLNRRYALTFEELIEAKLLKSEPTIADTGYEFKLRPAADAQTYKLAVDPGSSNASARHFFTDQTGVIHAESGKDATAESPVAN